MASVQFTAPTRATYGVRHSNIRLTGRFTVISNDLIQHPEMSAVARILGIYIQSLPAGTPIGIKDLARQLPLGETSIAGGLRELVRFGYLERSLESLPGGRIVTRTVSYNHPRAVTDAPPPPAPPPPSPPPLVADRGPHLAADPEPVPAAEPAPAAPEPAAASAPAPGAAAPAAPAAPAAASAEVSSGPAAARVPVPRDRDNALRRRLATEILAELRLADPRLLLGARDITYLAGGVEAWLERGATVHALVAALTANLPDPPRNPAGLIAHRLSAQLPPAVAPAPRRAAFVAPDPFQICDGCDRAYRSPTRGGRCNDCGPPGTGETRGAHGT
ncbi:helix-turn-helix domain-containing protein [Streptomyces sp. NPDC006544]|uniref:helix-turn-helix domain-containing protein n=1 Tax=Streptomyces sp. NPDC006544 TaxID=3154583 RepID=UPI0033A7A950